MSGIVVRPARAHDLPAAAAIYAELDVEIDRRTHPLSGLADADTATKSDAALRDLRLLREEDPRQVWVAARDQVVGVAAAVIRGRHWHLTYLFVAPHSQERGIGGELLRHIHDAGQEAGCTAFTLQASDDPRALTRYFRLGLFPLPPPFVWTAAKPRFPDLGLTHPLESHLLRLDDISALNTVDDVDKAVRGVRRPQDVRRWLRDGATGALLTDRASGRPAGYYLVTSEGETGRIGPVAAMDEPRFGDVLRNALAAAAALHVPGKRWIIAAPGENRATIEPLFSSGFRPSYFVTFLASQSIGRFDRYLFHDLDHL